MDDSPRFYRNQYGPIVIIEDNDDDYFLLEAYLRKNLPKHLMTMRFRTTEEAIADLTKRLEDEQVELPCLFLLDLNMPGMGGLEALKHIKATPVLNMIPVVILTSSHWAKDVNACYQYGASSYIIKDMDINVFEERLNMMLDYWLNNVVLPTRAHLQSAKRTLTTQQGEADRER